MKKQWSNKVVFLSVNPKTEFCSDESFLKDPLDLKSEDETKLAAIKFEAYSKTDFRQLAWTPWDFVDKTCFIGAPWIDIDGAVSRVLNLCLGCIQSQFVSNEPITDINRSDLDLNKSQYNRHYQKQRIDECHPHTSQADNGTENLGDRYYKGTVKVPRLFPEECCRTKNTAH